MSKVIVTKSKLDAINTAIDTKSGTAANRTLDEMVTAIGAIPTGEPNYIKLALPSGSLQYRWAYGIFEENEDFEVDASDIFRDYAGTENPIPVNNAFFNARKLKSIKITNLNNRYQPVSGNYLYPSYSAFAERTSAFGLYNDNLETVIIETNNGLPIQPDNTSYAFSGRSKLKNVYAVFDFSHISNYDSGYNFRSMFAGCTSLEEVRFAPNSILWMNTSYQLFNVSQNLSDNSLCSIANALAVGSAYPNLKLLSTPYARCSTLMGTVTDGFFTQDDVNGTVSLADFITNTKGWTLSV